MKNFKIFSLILFLSLPLVFLHAQSFWTDLGNTLEPAGAEKVYVGFQGNTVLQLEDIGTNNNLGGGAHMELIGNSGNNQLKAIINMIHTDNNFRYRSGALELRPPSRINFYTSNNVTNPGALAMTVLNDGNVGIGVTSPTNKLEVCGTIRANEVKVESDWCDYVFEPSYPLASLEEVKAHIEEKGYLHRTPSAAQIEAEGGVKLAASTLQQQEKIEEIFLHLIDLNEQVKSLQEQTELLKRENQLLKSKLNKQ